MAKKTVKPVTDPKKAVVYIRASTEEQHLGPEAQRAAVEQWAYRQGVSIVAIHRDLGVSGGTPLAECDGLVSALLDLDAHGAGLLLVAKRDRLARDLMKMAMIRKEVEGRGATVISAAGEGEGDDPAAKLMQTMIDAFAEYELAIIKARTKAALQAKKKKGERIGGVPYGFSDLDGKLVPNDAEREVIVAARELSSRGVSLRGICRMFTEEKVVFRNFSWSSPAHAERLLKAEV